MIIDVTKITGDVTTDVKLAFSSCNGNHETIQRNGAELIITTYSESNEMRSVIRIADIPKLIKALQVGNELCGTK